MTRPPVLTERERDWSVHPGELLSEWLAERHLSQFKAAQDMGVSAAFVSMICNGHKGVGPGVAIRLENLTGIPAELWVRMQADYDLIRERNRRSRPAA